MIGTALTAKSTKVLFCGAGELGREVVIAMQRLGVETIAVDRYPNAPGMQVAHRSHTINMLDGVITGDSNPLTDEELHAALEKDAKKAANKAILAAGRTEAMTQKAEFKNFVQKVTKK